MKQVLKSPNKSTMIDDLIKNYSKTHARRVDYYPVPHRDPEFMLNKTASWNDMKSQRSRIVCNAEDTRDPAKHFAAVVVCCGASPTRSRSKQSNESAVVEDYTKKEADAMENLKNHKY